MLHGTSSITLKTVYKEIHPPTPLPCLLTSLMFMQMQGNCVTFERRKKHAFIEQLKQRVFCHLSFIMCDAEERVEPKPIRLVAAVSRNMGIGRKGDLPWNLPSVPEHVHSVCRNMTDAIKMASTPPLSEKLETIWVLGGAEPYAEATKHPWCDQIHITDIMEDFDCDTFFPEFDRDVFKLAEKFPGIPSGIQEENGIKYAFQVYQRDAMFT
uniref:dihydrofolate reductase n=1 Tax=Geotrypetes seraphini TaxID=260995 RepID=A0A6P8RUT3_GEOSA|nr:dihydrofolate reductase-like isoform X2 [Geotrypetes seraphini]